MEQKVKNCKSATATGEGDMTADKQIKIGDIGYVVLLNRFGELGAIGEIFKWINHPTLSEELFSIIKVQILCIESQLYKNLPISLDELEEIDKSIICKCIPIEDKGPFAASDLLFVPPGQLFEAKEIAAGAIVDKFEKDGRERMERIKEKIGNILKTGEEKE